MLKDSLKAVEDAMAGVETAKATLTAAQQQALQAQSAVDVANAAYLKVADAAEASQAALQKELADLMPPKRHVIR